MRPLLAILAAVMLLAAAGCGAQASSHATAQPVSLGTLRLVKTTGKVIRLSGGPTSGYESRSFLLRPRAGFTCLWQCPGFGKGSSFSATLQYGGEPQSTAQLADTSRGDPPVGAGGWANLDETNGRILKQWCNVLVTSKRCHWSLTLLFGAHALVRYDNPVFAFSLSFDPNEAGFAPSCPRALDPGEAQAVGGTSGVLVALTSGAQDAGCVLGVQAVQGIRTPVALAPAQVEALGRSMDGWQTVGVPQPVTLAGVSGYRLGVRWPGSQPMVGAVYLLASGSHRYTLFAVTSPGHPRLARQLDRLVNSLRITAS